MRKFPPLCLTLGLLCMVLSAGTLPAQSQQTNGSPASAAVSLTPEFSAGTFEEIDGEILLHVKLNDTLDTRFMLDSANWTSILSAEALKSLNIPLQTSGSGESKVTQGKLARLTLGKATLTDVNLTSDEDDFCTEWNKEHPEAPIGGVLGQDALERNALGLDFATHTYGLWLGGKLKPQDAENFNRVVAAPSGDAVYSLRPGASLHVGSVTLKNPRMRHTTPQVVPLEKAEGDYMYHTLVQLNDVPVKVFVSPGLHGLNLAESIASQLRALPYLSAPASNPGDKAGSGDKVGPAATLYYVRKFRMGSFETLLNFASVDHRSKETPTDTVLGVTSFTFSNCRVILDFPGNALYVSAYDPEAGLSTGKNLLAKLFDQGLFFPPNTKEPTLALLIGKGSAAERVGLKDGDELLEVNGKSLTALGKLRDHGDRLLAQKPLRVTVRRQDQFEKQVFEFPADYAVTIHFTGDTPPFPDDWLKPPMDAKATYFDAVQDRTEFVKAPNVLYAELAKYPPTLLEKTLSDIYVFKTLVREKVSVGGFGWAEAKRLYLQDDSATGLAAESYLRLIIHHEVAHLLLADNPSHFSRSRWESLNPPMFQYGKGGIEFMRAGNAGGTQLEPTWWKKGFARPYSVADLDEDFATLCEAMFSGDPRFWKAVDSVEILRNKVTMIVDFYQSLDKTLTESYFRQLVPTINWSMVPRSHYENGDTVYFANGGKTVSADNPPKITEYPPGSFAIFSDKEAVIWYPPAK